MIDRNKILNGLECHRSGFCFACPYNDDVIETTNCKRQLVEDTIELLKSQPEQKPGHWENDKYGNMICSVCGGLAIQAMTGCLVDRHLASYMSDYCPHCGAKMDKGVTQDG